MFAESWKWCMDEDLQYIFDKPFTEAEQIILVKREITAYLLLEKRLLTFDMESIRLEFMLNGAPDHEYFPNEENGRKIVKTSLVNDTSSSDLVPVSTNDNNNSSAEADNQLSAEQEKPLLMVNTWLVSSDGLNEYPFVIKSDSYELLVKTKEGPWVTMPSEMVENFYDQYIKVFKETAQRAPIWSEIIVNGTLLYTPRVSLDYIYRDIQNTNISLTKSGIYTTYSVNDNYEVKYDQPVLIRCHVHYAFRASEDGGMVAPKTIITIIHKIPQITSPTFTRL